MEQIDAGHEALDARPVEASFAFSSSNRSMKGLEVAIANLLISDNDAENQRQLADIDSAKESGIKSMTAAARFSPSRANAIKAHARSIFNVDRNKAIELGAVATEPAAILASQKVYLTECVPQIDQFAEPNIAASAHAQVAGLHQVNTAVNQMDQVTQQNAAMWKKHGSQPHPGARNGPIGCIDASIAASQGCGLSARYRFTPRGYLDSLPWRLRPNWWFGDAQSDFCLLTHLQRGLCLQSC